MKTNHTLLAAAFVSALTVGTSTVCAGDAAAKAPAADPMAAYKTDKGLISLTKAAPEMTAVSDYTGDFLSRAALLGDFGGWRTDLYNHGLTLDAQLTQVYQGVTSGGSRNGHGDWEYNGLLEYNMTIDTAKAGLWSGGMFGFTGMTSWGDPLQKQAGNLLPINSTALWPNSYEPSTELMEFYLAQALTKKTVIFIGRLDPSNFLDQNSFSCTSDSQFFNVGMNSNPLFGSFLTYSTYAALFMTQVTDGLSLAYGAWTPNTAPGDYDGDWSDYGAAIIPIFKYQAFGHPGMIQAIMAYTNKDSIDVGNPRLLPDLATGSKLPTKPENWIVELSGEQYLWEPKGSSAPKAEGGRKEDFHVPTKDFAASKPGLGVFYRFSYVPEDRNPYNMYASGGIGGRGVIPNRPYDRFGVGAYWLKESNDLDKQPGNVVGDEKGVEAFYNIAITPSVQISFDAQWISPGIRSSDDAWVLGTRLNIRF
jgi:porin